MRKHLTTFFWISRLGTGAAFLALFAFTAACVLSVSNAQAGLITSWNNFSVAAGPYTATTIGTSFSSAQLMPSGTYGSNNGYQIVNNTDPNGGPKMLKFPTPAAMNGATITLTLVANSAVSLSLLTFDDYKNNNNPSKTMDWTYSISGGGGSGTIDSSLSLGTGGWVDQSLSLSGISVPSGETITFIGTISKDATAGVLDFQNFNITAVPEPINYGLAGFGLIFLGGSAGRFYLGRRRVVAAS